MSCLTHYFGSAAQVFLSPPNRLLILSLDFETYSEADLKKTGASVYARHPTTEVLMLAYGVTGEEPEQWVPSRDGPMPAALRDMLMDPTIALGAWNAAFERNIFEHTLKIAIPTERWLDSMVLALSLSLPGKLSMAGKAIGLPEDKQKSARGMALIRKFCKPRKPTKYLPHTRSTAETDPVEWDEFLEYNRQDVISEQAIYRRLRRYQMPDHEWALWHLDQKINDAGIPINLNAVEAAVTLTAATIKSDLAKMRGITGLANPNSSAQLLPWLREHGYKYLDLKKGHVARAWEELGESVQTGDNHPEEIKDLYEVLELRLRVSKASVKKFTTLSLSTDEDGNLRGCHQFAGAARTWRWAGRRFQPQNLSKPEKYLEKRIAELVHDLEHMTPDEIGRKYANPMDVLVACVRPMVQAPKGFMLIDADLSAIENVVLGWLAKDDKILRVFREGLDPYIDFATDMFGMSYAEIEAVVNSGDKSMRTTAKPGVLGCLRGDTPVLTDQGWKFLVDLRSDDLLFDGVEWVKHGGVVFKGYQPVQSIAGLHATPDHRFLANEEWRPMCQLVSQPTTFESALATASGLFSRLPDPAEARERLFGAAANAGWNGNYLAATSSGDFRSNAPAALLRTVAATPESESDLTFSTFSLTASMLRALAAKTQKTVSTNTTTVGVFAACSQTQRNGWPISLTTLVQTGTSKSTESTTTEITGSVICDWRPAASKTETSETWDILNTGVRSRFVVLTDSGPVLAHNCGYMLGAGDEQENHQTGEMEATGLLGYSWAMQVPLTKEMAALSVKTFRAKFLDVVQFWWDLDKAARKTIRTGEPQTVGYLTFDMKGPFMRIGLPSGRHLHYLRPKLQMRKMPWGGEKVQITYENLEKGQWRRVTTHPGKLAENVTQAVARDILAHGMTLADAKGIDIRMHVHDQIVGLCPEGMADAQLAVLIDCMTTLPDWADDTLPLKAAGFCSPIFVKD